MCVEKTLSAHCHCNKHRAWVARIKLILYSCYLNILIKIWFLLFYGDHFFLVKSILRIAGSKCSKIRLILASIELSHTIRPSWLLKNIPPKTALYLSSKLYSLTANVVCIYFPVYSCRIAVNRSSHFGKVLTIKSRWSLGA